MRWMEIAWSQVGVHETSGAPATPAIVEYFRAAGRPEIASDEVAWCMAFVLYCLAKGGVAQKGIAGIPKAERLLAVSALKLGSKIDAPRVGAVAVLRTDVGHHTGLVQGWTDSHVQILGGNQSSSVSVALFRRSSLVGLRWPEDPVSAGALAAAGSRIATAAGRQQADAAKASVVGTSGQVVPADVGALAGPVKQLEQGAQALTGLKGAVEVAEAFVLFGVKKWPVIAAVLALYWLGRIGWDAWVARQARTEDHNTGANPMRADDAGGADVQAL